ncbi:lipid kinase [Nocardioides fonticola]|uniref:Lipid kinase n=1 Tax=Nocardioides fonticola TaxID=450363 RepID=A0ABP7XU01_9ACTN
MTPPTLATLLARPVPVVINPRSRRGAAAQPALDAGLRAADVTPVFVDPGDDLRAALTEVLADAPPLVLVGGGDGTIGCAADLVAHTDTVLGVVPLGTANDFARTLEIDPDPVRAIEQLLTGRIVDVDLGRAGRSAFLNVASLGFSVAVTERLTARSKKHLGPLAYPWATLRAYRSAGAFSARLHFPDGDHPDLELDGLLQIAVGNGVHYGGGNTVSPTASVDDHLLDVYAIERGRLREHLSIARLLRDGSLVEHDRVHHVVTRRVAISTDEPMPVNLDGEIAESSPLTFEVERNAVHVVVPAHSRAARYDG